MGKGQMMKSAQRKRLLKEIKPSCLFFLTLVLGQYSLADSAISKLKIDDDYRNSISVTHGIQYSNFSWEISRSSNDSRPISMLDYSDMHVDQTKATININDLLRFKPSNWTFATTLGYGKIRSGTLIDSDYSYSNSGQTLETQSIASLKGSKTYLIDVEVQRNLSQSKFSNTQFNTGINWTQENYKLSQGYQKISQAQSVDNEILGLNSGYDTQWLGPYAGLSQSFFFDHQTLQINSRLKGFIYTAEGQWNLREEFAQPKSFEHLAFGTGIELSLTHKLEITNSMFLKQDAGFSYARTFDGSDEVFYKNGSTQSTQLLPVEKTDFSYNVGFSWVM